MSRRQRNRSSEEEEYASPWQLSTPPASVSSLSPPEAKRICRTHGRSSSNSTASIDLPRGTFDIRNEDYRSIGPLYLPLPTIHGAGVGPNRQREWNRGLERVVKTILKKYDVHWTSCDLVRRQSVARTIQESPPVDSIFVFAQKSLPGADTWPNAAEEILSACQKSTVTKDLNVEIADARGLVPTVSRPIPANEPLVNNWEKACSEVVKCCGKNRDMLTLNLLHRGKATFLDGAPEEHRFKPTIVLVIRRDSIESWGEVRDAIVKLLGTRYAHIAVEILRGDENPWFVDTGTIPAVSHGAKLWQNVAYMGASIGTKQSHAPGLSKTSATLGCFLQLRKSKETRIFGLTNFHVAFSLSNDDFHNPFKGQPKKYEALFTNGCVMGPGSTNQIPTPRMMMPSQDDSESAAKFYSDEIAKLETGAVYQEVHALVQKCPDTNPSDMIARAKAATYEQHNRILRQYRNCVQLALQSDEGDRAAIGNVFAVSGTRVDRDQWLMDWALVQIVQNRRPAVNNLVDASTSGEALIYPGRAIVSASLDSMEDPAPLEQVFKTGRTSGKTTGWVNPVKLVKFHGYDNDGILKQGKALTITPLGPYDASKDTSRGYTSLHGTVFSMPGDSGSAIFNKDGSFKGLLFGDDDATGISNFTPMSALIADIKKITGATEVELLGAA